MSQTTQSSNIEKNKQLVRNFVEDVFNRHDMAAVDKYMAGGEGFKQYLGGFFPGHPDSRTTIDHIVGEGDKVFVMFTTKATNKQTGKRITKNLPTYIELRMVCLQNIGM
ncbi:MAG: nuclear transport factor 2 family protein [Thaumarchaeota archaeon]|nr:MAG: nuclear transport factor 2 family protein [Nitrososphaerota archaeon]